MKSYKFRLMAFRPSRELFRDPIRCPKPIVARYSGRAVFRIDES